MLDAEMGDTGGVVAFPARPACCAAGGGDRDLLQAAARMPGSPRRAGGPRVLVTSDRVAYGKPAPDPYLLAAERLGVDPAACLVLEDAPTGIAAGRAAG